MKHLTALLATGLWRHWLMVKTQNWKAQERERSHEIFSRLATVTKKTKTNTHNDITVSVSNRDVLTNKLNSCYNNLSVLGVSSFVSRTLRPSAETSSNWFQTKSQAFKSKCWLKEHGCTVPPASPSLPQRRPSNGYATLVRNGFQLNGTRIIFTVRKLLRCEKKILFIAIKLPPRDCTVSWL